MNEEIDISRQREARKHAILEAMQTAYDLSSDGMGVHMHAVVLAGTMQELPLWVLPAVSTHGSNYLYAAYSAYSGQWGYGESAFQKSTWPHIDDTKRILGLMMNMYGEIDWLVTREVLAGVSTHEDKTKPITSEELGDYLRAADNGSLLERFGKSEILSIEEIIGKLDPKVVLHTSLDSRNLLIRSDVTFSQKFYDTEDSVMGSRQHRPLILRAAVYKLGVMLDFTNQLLHEASKSGNQRAEDFLPEDRGALYQQWEDKFNEDVPNLGELYIRAHKIFMQYADPYDENLAYLFNLNP